MEFIFTLDDKTRQAIKVENKQLTLRTNLFGLIPESNKILLDDFNKNTSPTKKLQKPSLFTLLDKNTRKQK